MMKNTLRTLIMFMFLIMLVPAALQAEIKLKIAVVNPSTTETQTTPVRFDLPKGVGPEQVVDSGDMEFNYDFEKGIYYVRRTVKLAPSERRVLEVKLHDIWTIPDKDLAFLESHTDQLTEKLKNTKHLKVGTELAAKIKEEVAGIRKKQTETALSVKDQMNAYYEDMQVLKEAKDNIGMLENLVLDVGGIVEERVQVPETMVVAVGREDNNPKLYKDLTIKISNPSDKAKLATQVKYYLPQEVTPRYILDRGGLDVGYDFNKESFYAYKDNIVLEPAQTMTFVIRIRDIWRVPDVELDSISAHVKNMIGLLKGSEYLNQGQAFADKINSNVTEISALNNKDVSTQEHIANFRTSEGLLKDARQALRQLEKLVSQAGASPGITVAEAETPKGGGPVTTRPKGYEGIDMIAKSIFKGKAPTVATTWKLIFTIIGFLGVVSALFFALWYIQIKNRQKIEDQKNK